LGVSRDHGLLLDGAGHRLVLRLLSTRRRGGHLEGGVLQRRLRGGGGGLGVRVRGGRAEALQRLVKARPRLDGALVPRPVRVGVAGRRRLLHQPAAAAERARRLRAAERRGVHLADLGRGVVVAGRLVA